MCDIMFTVKYIICGKLNMKKKIIGILISILITVLFIRAAAKLFDFETLKSLGGFNKPLMLSGAVCYVFTYLFRAGRIHCIAKPEKGFGTTLLVCFRHQFFGRILPFKTGDLSLPYLLKKYCGKEIEHGGGTLAAIRFFDGAVMLSSFLICTALTLGKEASDIIYACTAAIALLAALPFIVSKFTAALAKRFPENKIVVFAEKVRISLASLSAKDFFVLLISTIILWIFIYLSMFFAARAFRIEISFISTVSASFLASAAALLPVNGLGGFGTTETGWTAGFVLFGAEKARALASGIASNIMSFVIICIFGAVSLLLGGEKDV